MRTARWLLVGLLAVACGEETSPDGERTRTERDAFGLITCSGLTDETTCFTNRALVGISMGAGGAGQIGFAHPELFDTIGTLGISIVDWVYMLRTVQRTYLGGFCDRETILAHLDEINDPNGRAFCGPVPGVERMEPSGKIIEPSQDFNHWYMGGKGGGALGLGRNWMRLAFQDIVIAFGNPFYASADSPYLPPGAPLDLHARSAEQACNPAPVIRGLKHKEYNPTGEHDVIVACDTATTTGTFDPEQPADAPFEILLAVDYNKNGKRDYAEPVLLMMHERFEDIGTSPDDAYDPFTHPTGTRGNWLYDEGEPFEDTGLDGVPDTGDYGEGNGRFDYSPHIAESFFPQNPRMLLATIPEEQLARIRIYADAGIRDFLGSAGGTNWMWGALQARVGTELARDYTRFESLPTYAPASGFDFLAVDYRPERIGQYAYVRYGDPNATETQIEAGDGDHVGTIRQAVERLLTALSFAQSSFHQPDRKAVEGDLDINRHIVSSSFYSNALGEERSFGIALPPGYFDPANADRRYPVLYFLHGLGDDPNQLFGSAILFLGYMQGSTRTEQRMRHQSDWAKFIIVFPNSTCRGGICNSGTFNANQKGLTGEGGRYEDAFFELMAHVESTYRVLPPIEIPR